MLKQPAKTLFIATLLSGVFAVTRTSDANGAESVAGPAATAVCNACHGPQGNSSVPAFPTLAGQGQRYVFKQLLDIQSGLRTVPEMAGMLDDLSPQDLSDIAAGYAAQPPVIEDVDVSPIEHDETLYSAGDINRRVPACVGCHSPDGTGNAAAGFPRLGGQHAEYVKNQLTAFRDGSRNNDGDTRVMRTIASKLNDHDIAALSAYIQGLH